MPSDRGLEDRVTDLEHTLGAGVTVPAGPGPDLAELSRPFPPDFVERKDGQDYVAHHVVNQRLLSVVGPFDFELVQVIRGDVDARPPDPSSRSRRGREGTPALRNVVVGGVWRLTCQVDGRTVRVEEVGDVGDVHNWPHDGARLKDAASDAIKRCCMRFGLGLSLWAQEHYFLDQQLRAQTRSQAPRPMPAPDPARVDAAVEDHLAELDQAGRPPAEHQARLKLAREGGARRRGDEPAWADR